MLRNLMPLGLGLVLVIGSAGVHGVMTDRWGTPADLTIASAQLEKIPHVVGNWHSQPVEIDERQIRIAEAVGYFCRAYRNDQTQEEVQVLVLCGPHGPIAVHPPTICFTSSGLEQAHPQEKQTIQAGDDEGEFWSTVFTKKSPDGVRLEMDTYWAWSVAGETEAADNPRIRYASKSHLYKIYVTHLRRPSAAEPKVSSKACEEFLQEFLPPFRSALSEESY